LCTWVLFSHLTKRLEKKAARYQTACDRAETGGNIDVEWSKLALDDFNGIKQVECEYADERAQEISENGIKAFLEKIGYTKQNTPTHFDEIEELSKELAFNLLWEETENDRKKSGLYKEFRDNMLYLGTTEICGQPITNKKCDPLLEQHFKASFVSS